MKRARGIGQINLHVLSVNLKFADRLGDEGADGRSKFIWTLKVLDVWGGFQFDLCDSGKEKNGELNLVCLCKA